MCFFCPSFPFLKYFKFFSFFTFHPLARLLIISGLTFAASFSTGSSHKCKLFLTKSGNHKSIKYFFYFSSWNFASIHILNFFSSVELILSLRAQRSAFATVTLPPHFSISNTVPPFRMTAAALPEELRDTRSLDAWEFHLAGLLPGFQGIWTGK